MSDKENQQIKIGKRAWGCDNGFRVIANDTSSRRPWMWFAPTLDTAKLLAKTICEQTGEEVEICKYIGSVRPQAVPTEFVEAKDCATESPTSPTTKGDQQ